MAGAEGGLVPGTVQLGEGGGGRIRLLSVQEGLRDQKGRGQAGRNKQTKADQV